MNLLSVVIPAYNEEGGVAEVIERILKVEPELQQVGLDGLELIIVDDCSSDRTAEIVESYADQGVRLIRHKVNKNYGGALKTGFRHAKGDYLAFMDADGTYPPEYYPKMFTALKAHNADLVIGSRMAGADSDMPLTRRIGNTVFAGLVSAIAHTRITDSASGQRILKREALEKLYPLPDGLNFTPVMSTRALHEDVKMVEVPIRYEERDGDSKLSVVHDGLRFLFSILGTASIYNPVRLLGAMSLAAVGLAVLAILPWLIAISNGIDDRSGYANLLFVAMTLAIVAVNLFSIGTVFNYIVSLFHRRPIRQGLFGRPMFRQPLEYRFGVIGVGLFLVGILMFVAAIAVPTGPEPAWFLLVPSAMFVMSGIQLGTSWLLVYMLRELSKRELKVDEDLGRNIDPLEDDTIILPISDNKALV